MTNNLGEKTLVSSCAFFLLTLLLFCKYEKIAYEKHHSNKLYTEYSMHTARRITNSPCPSFHCIPYSFGTITERCQPTGVIFEHSLITYIVECTDAYATTRLSQMPPSWRLLLRSWKQATFAEIKAFVGMKLNTALVPIVTVEGLLVYA